MMRVEIYFLYFADYILQSPPTSRFGASVQLHHRPFHLILPERNEDPANDKFFSGLVT